MCPTECKKGNSIASIFFCRLNVDSRKTRAAATVAVVDKLQTAVPIFWILCENDDETTTTEICPRLHNVNEMSKCLFVWKDNLFFYFSLIRCSVLFFSSSVVLYFSESTFQHDSKFIHAFISQLQLNCICFIVFLFIHIYWTLFCTIFEMCAVRVCLRACVYVFGGTRSSQNKCEMNKIQVLIEIWYKYSVDTFYIPFLKVNVVCCTPVVCVHDAFFIPLNQSLARLFALFRWCDRCLRSINVL